MPNNESNVSAVMSHNIREDKEQKESFAKQENNSVPKRRWSIGKTSLLEFGEKNNYVERRMTLPLLKPKKRSEPKCELMTPVQNQGNKGNGSEDHIRLNIIFKFWKSEDDLGKFLEKMDVSSFTEIAKVSDLVNTKLLAEDMSITEISELVQTIYKIANLKIRRKVLENEKSIDSGQRILVKFEDRLMRGLHDNVFGKIIVEETKSDRKLSNTIENLSWVTPTHLLAKLDDSDKKVSDTFDKAMFDVATINFKESPVAKLGCIMNCSRRIFEILKTRPDSSESADDFLSILVFVILQSNPARLHSNIRYVLQFGNCDQIMRDEEGYYFTHLCSVVSFIENLTAQSLDLSEEEFHRLSMSSNGKNGNKYGLRTRRISCSRQMSLRICRIYHRAADGRPLTLHEDNLLNNSFVLQEQVCVMGAT